MAVNKEIRKGARVRFTHPDLRGEVGTIMQARHGHNDVALVAIDGWDNDEKLVNHQYLEIVREPAGAITLEVVERRRDYKRYEPINIRRVGGGFIRLTVSESCIMGVWTPFARADHLNEEGELIA